MKSSFSILVNTTDNFEDCWIPFFTLFKKYWPEFNGLIYLNTENKDFTFDNLNIISIKNNASKSSWSECLRYALNYINEEHILYLQEDYFLKSEVDSNAIDSFFQLFSNNNFDCLHLTDQSTPGPFIKNTGIKGVWEVSKGANYRLSTQAAFWKKDSLLKLIQNWENGWQFEHYGTKRSNYILKKVMVIDSEKYGINKIEILPYVFTGIIKGKWKNEVVDLFNSNNISIDFSMRGFSSDLNNYSLIKYNPNKITTYLNNLRSEINFIKLLIWQN